MHAQQILELNFTYKHSSTTEFPTGTFLKQGQNTSHLKSGGERF